MPGTVSPSLPVLGSANATEDPKVRSAFITLRDALNAVLTSSNQVDGAQIGAGTIPASAIATGAGIALSKLASGADKQIIVCNASGVPVYNDLTGDATISNLGVLTIANLAVTNAKLAAGAALANLATASVPDSKLISPNNVTYKTIVTADGFIADVGLGDGNPTGSVYILGSSGGKYGMRDDTLDGNQIGANDKAPKLFYFASADLAVAGLTSKLRLRAQAALNATNPTVDITVKMVPVTVAGATDKIHYSSGTTVTGSSVTLATSAVSSTIVQGATSDFDVPTAGMYMLVANVGTGGFANNAAASVHAQLQFRNV